MGKFLVRLSPSVAILTICALLIWLTGIPTWLSRVEAASTLTSVKDTLGDSDLSVATTHAFTFTTVTALDATDTIVFTFDPAPGTGLFEIAGLVVADFTNESGIDVVAACTGPTSNEFTMAFTAETITLTQCAGDSVAALTAVAFTIANNRITNPNAENSYVIRIETKDAGVTVLDKADPRVAIVEDVLVEASVSTSFTFTVNGVTNGATVNGDTDLVTDDSTATSLNFGTIASSTGPVLLAQDLTVSTNAKNGFVVTVVGDGALESSTGADIDQFKDGVITTSPTGWTAPITNIDAENTWGHYGITSEDADLNGNEFGLALYAGNFATSSRQVFSHGGPADGSTADKGATRVGYKIEISDLQEAGDDYTQTLTYVATPTF